MPRPTRTTLIACLVVVAAGSGPSSRAADPGPTSVEAVLDLAWQLQVAHRYADAARALDGAVPTHALYRLGAAESWALAGELTNAEARLAQALADPNLDGAARLRAEALLTRVRAATPHAALARMSSPVEAAPAWEAAFAASDLGVFLARAGRAWETAGRPAAAIAALTAALQRADLPEDEAAALPVRLTALRAALPPPPPSRTAAWLTAGVGATALAFGATSFLVADAHRSDVVDALREPVVTSLTRAEAQRKQALVDSWNLAGWVSVGAGLALVTTGLLLFASEGEPDSRASVRVEARVTPDGPFLLTRGVF